MSEKPRPAGISMRAVEIAVSAFTLAFGALVAYASWQLGARWASDGPQAGYFPFYIGLIICTGSVVNLLQAVLARSAGYRRSFVEWEPLKRVFAVIIPAGLYAASVYLVGIYVSSMVYIAVFMIWIGKYSWYRGVAVGFGVSFVLFLMFEIWFQVLLPKGAYNVLDYFGY